MKEITLTDEQYGMVQECIEYISANERSYGKKEEKLISEIAKIFNAEYIPDANTNWEEWQEELEGQPIGDEGYDE